MSLKHHPMLPFQASVYVNGYSSSTTVYDLFSKNRLAVIFGFPGAYMDPVAVKAVTDRLAAFKDAGADIVAIVTPNDHFVNEAWQRLHLPEAVCVVSDGNLEFSRGLGVMADAREVVMHFRPRPFALAASEGKILYLKHEKNFEFSDQADPQHLLDFLRLRARGL